MMGDEATRSVKTQKSQAKKPSWKKTSQKHWKSSVWRSLVSFKPSKHIDIQFTYIYNVCMNIIIYTYTYIYRVTFGKFVWCHWWIVSSYPNRSTEVHCHQNWGTRDDSGSLKHIGKKNTKSEEVLLMEEILHQLPVEVGSLSHYLQGFIRPRWCRISSINSITGCLG